jgi:hypothetical protein
MSNRVSLLSRWLISILALGLGLTTASIAQPSKRLHMQPNVIVDQTGFGKPTPAITLFTPVGWKASGGVVWGEQFACTKYFAFNWKVTTPDELTGAALLPQQGWEFNNSGANAANLGCQIAQITNVEAYLRTLLKSARSDATNIRFRKRPDLVQEIANNRWDRQWQMGTQHFWTEGGELLFNVTEKGVGLEASLMTTVSFMKTITKGQAYHGESVFANADPAMATFAPVGQYNPALFDAMRKSARFDPQWQQAIAEHIRIINKTNMDGARARHNIKMQTYREIGDMIQQSWKRQQASNDRRAQDFIDAIREKQDFNDPESSTGRTKLSSNYNHAWRLADGTFVMTDDPSFNPATELGIEGNKLNRSR